MRRVVFAVFGTVAGLVGLLSFKTHPQTAASPPAGVSTTLPASAMSAAGAASTTGSAATSGSSSTTSRSAKATATATAPATATSKTYTGTAVDTRYGPVQVRIVVRNGKLASVTAVEYPQNQPRDQQINGAAVPQLNNEALKAGNAKIDMVSGATYTSQGYLDSLQSALDKARL